MWKLIVCRDLVEKHHHIQRDQIRRLKWFIVCRSVVFNQKCYKVEFSFIESSPSFHYSKQNWNMFKQNEVCLNEHHNLIGLFFFPHSHVFCYGMEIVCRCFYASNISAIMIIYNVGQMQNSSFKSNIWVMYPFFRFHSFSLHCMWVYHLNGRQSSPSIAFSFVCNKWTNEGKSVDTK